MTTEELRALMEKATPGPWSKTTYGTASTSKVAGVLSSAAYASARQAGVSMTDMTEINAPDRDGALVGFTGNGPTSPENAALIAAAVNAMPALLDVVELVRPYHASEYHRAMDRGCPICDALDRLAAS